MRMDEFTEVKEIQCFREDRDYILYEYILLINRTIAGA